MSKIKLIFGLLVIAAIIVGGCTGTKTAVNDQSTAKAVALNDYTKCAKELSDEINFLKNHYELSPNATLDQYQAWLDGYREKLALCRQMYNNTTAASLKYLGYLNNTSSEYRNVTAADDAYAGDIELLNQTYWNNSAYLDTSIKKAVALDKYRAKLNSTMDAYNAISGLIQGTKIDSLETFAQFLDRLKGKASAYEDCADAAIDAGKEYGSYCDPGSEEYKALQDNNNALKDGVRKLWDSYTNYKNEYDSKSGAKVAAQSMVKDYVDKFNKASAAMKDVNTYRTTELGPLKLDKGWLDGYKQKIDAFDAASNDAIASGNTIKEYLDPSSEDYKTLTKNENDMKNQMSSYNDNYNTLYKGYRTLHPLGSLMQ